MGKFDFSGYATRNDVKCSDGRTIRKDAFKNNDGARVPLVWQHVHNDPSNVLGHATLENREDGVYAYCSLNDTPAGKNAKELVEHGDITALSIYANNLVEKSGSVLHGAIREVSLVLSGANPGAFIDNLAIQHSDGSFVTDESEAIIYSGLDISTIEVLHSEEETKTEGEPETKEEVIVHADKADKASDKSKKEGEKDMSNNSEKTVQEVFDTLSDEQKDVVYFMIGTALEEAGAEGDAAHSFEGGYEMKKNIFEGTDMTSERATLSHSQFQEIVADAQKYGSLRESFLAHTQTYGIENIDYLFPDAQNVLASPSFIKRDTDWVIDVMNGTKHTPFSRIKSTAADITAEAARALGYVTGALKKEEVISLLKRVTYATTIYKKQKLDRDDIVDITDLDVVAFLKGEMRIMLDEELARAILVGDGRAAESEDKIDETCIRPIYKDDNTYAHHVSIPVDADTSEIVDAIVRARKYYKGSGNPVFFTTTDKLADMMLIKDTTGRRLYNNETELASALRVSKIVEVPVMEGLVRTEGMEDLALIGIIVNLKDYVVGADKGGQVSMFDDFDIDYNQYKYLIETRCSGALVQPKSALVIEQVVQGN